MNYSSAIHYEYDNDSSSQVAICYRDINVKDPHWYWKQLPRWCMRSAGSYDPCRNICHYGYEVYPFTQLWNKPEAIQIHRYIYPVFLLFTAFANVLILLVLSKKHMRTPTNVVLLCMALADLLVALVPFPFMAFYYLMLNYKQTENLQTWWCSLALYLTDAMPPFCHNAAIWLTVLLAAQRFVYVQWPLTAQGWCSIRNVMLASAVIFLVSFLCAAPKFIQMRNFQVLKFIIVDRHKDITFPQFQCIFRYSSIVKKVTENVYFSSFYWTRVIGFIITPSILLILFSALLIRGISKAQQRKNRLLRENKRTEAHRQNESNSTSIMLVVVVVIFLIVNLPQGVMLTLFIFQQTWFQHLQIDADALNLSMYVDNMLILATYPINFAIYCGMSTQFRETFKRLFWRSLPPVRLNRSNSQYYSLANGKELSNPTLSNYLDPSVRYKLNTACAADNELSAAHQNLLEVPTTLI